MMPQVTLCLDRLQFRRIKLRKLVTSSCSCIPFSNMSRGHIGWWLDSVRVMQKDLEIDTVMLPGVFLKGRKKEWTRWSQYTVP